MRILIVAHYQGDGSPTAIFIHDQIRAYAALGHTVRVIAPIALGKTGVTGDRLAGGKTCIDGIWHYYLRYLSLSRFGQRHFNTASAISALRMKLKTILQDFQPDIIHAHTLGFDSAIGTWLKNRLNCPLVVTVHGSDVSIPYEQGNRAYLRDCCAGADTVVAVSSALAGKLKSCDVKIPIRSILNGFNLKALPEEAEKVPFSVIQVGNLIAQKRTDMTIRALAQLRNRYSGATLTIVGQGPERETLEQLCQNLGVSDAVRYTGQIPNACVLEEMAKAQFFVMPSVREGFGVVYLEAMAAGCVTIGTQGEGIDGFVQHGVNGFLVPADTPDAISSVIAWCIEHPQEADAVAARGRQAARELTWEKNARQYVELFSKITQKGELA